MLRPCEEVTVKGFIDGKQLGCLIRRRDTLTCGKQSDFLPARVALMLVIVMLFMRPGNSQSTYNLFALNLKDLGEKPGPTL